MLLNGSFAKDLKPWVLEESGAKGEVMVAHDRPDRGSSVKIRVVSVGDKPWRLQLYQGGLTIQKGAKYELTYWVKAAKAGVITVNCMQNHEPWEHHGAASELPVTTKWKELKFAFTGPWDDTNARITFTNLGTVPGQTYWFAQCSLKQVSSNYSEPSKEMWR